MIPHESVSTNFLHRHHTETPDRFVSIGFADKQMLLTNFIARATRGYNKECRRSQEV